MTNCRCTTSLEKETSHHTSEDLQDVQIPSSHRDVVERIYPTLDISNVSYNITSSSHQSPTYRSVESFNELFHETSLQSHPDNDHQQQSTRCTEESKESLLYVSDSYYPEGFFSRQISTATASVSASEPNREHSIVTDLSKEKEKSICPTYSRAMQTNAQIISFQPRTGAGRKRRPSTEEEVTESEQSGHYLEEASEVSKDVSDETVSSIWSELSSENTSSSVSFPPTSETQTMGLDIETSLCSPRNRERFNGRTSGHSDIFSNSLSSLNVASSKPSAYSIPFPPESLISQLSVACLDCTNYTHLPSLQQELDGTNCPYTEPVDRRRVTVIRRPQMEITELTSVRFSRSSPKALASGGWEFSLHHRVPKECLPQLLPITNLEYAVLSRLRRKFGEGANYCGVILKVAVVKKRRSRAIEAQRWSSKSDVDRYAALSAKIPPKPQINSVLSSSLSIESPQRSAVKNSKSGLLYRLMDSVQRKLSSSRSLTADIFDNVEFQKPQENEISFTSDSSEKNKFDDTVLEEQLPSNQQNLERQTSEKIPPHGRAERQPMGGFDSCSMDNQSKTHWNSSSLSLRDLGLMNKSRLPKMKMKHFVRSQLEVDLLEERIQNLHCIPIEVQGDFHEYVRHITICHISDMRDRYAPFFSGEMLEEYLLEMSRPLTWGDELTIRAIADAFQSSIHIITSRRSNWYLHYDPQDSEVVPELIDFCPPTTYALIGYNSMNVDQRSLSTLLSTIIDQYDLW